MKCNMKKLTLLIIVFAFVFVNAETSENNLEIIKSFRNYFEVPLLETETPEVLNIELPINNNISHFGVYNITNDRFEPYLYIEPSNVVLGEELLSITTTKGSSEGINDKSYNTYKDFDLDKDGNGSVKISYLFQNDIRSNSIDLSLGQYVSLPNLITIKATVDGSQKTLLSNSRPTSGKITFPETVSGEWEIEFKYSQPLRINELQINNLNIIKTSPQLNFLAQPYKDYLVYTNPDAIVQQKISERPKLNMNDDMESISISNFLENKKFQLSDYDGDGIPDINDNCSKISNIDQIDVNNNNRGDVCDDFDRDGILNISDNCVNEPNRNQIDTDGDGIGDTCDEEESRFTEKNQWLIWLGIISAALIFLGLLASVVRKTRFKEMSEKKGDTTDTPIE